MQPSGGKSLWSGLPIRSVIAYVGASREVRSLKHMLTAREKFRHLGFLLRQNIDANRMRFGADWAFEFEEGSDQYRFVLLHARSEILAYTVIRIAVPIFVYRFITAVEGRRSLCSDV